MFFIHGLQGWSRSTGIFVHPDVICCSLHVPGKTNPLRPFGYVLDVPKEAVVASYPRDVCSRIVKGGRVRGVNRKSVEDCGTNWGLLLELTPEGKHNEVWIRGCLVDIIGYYVNRSGVGSNVFAQACSRHGIGRIEL